MFISRILSLTTWFLGCAITTNAQTGSHSTLDLPNRDALYNIRAKLCGGAYANTACSAVDDTGALKGACWEWDANNPSYQGLIIGDNPPSQDCYVCFVVICVEEVDVQNSSILMIKQDAFEAMIEKAILDKHVVVKDDHGLNTFGYWSHAVYTYSGRTYLLAADSP
ncbi:hypothetical protein BGZ63DRAFT_401989 [Mariannaea sp. PMI_226]|nr:hypothetical protein BGZ63DRAFT_401989 [Mariannaea sp. PMI_226]